MIQESCPKLFGKVSNFLEKIVEPSLTLPIFLNPKILSKSRASDARNPLLGP